MPTARDDDIGKLAEIVGQALDSVEAVRSDQVRDKLMSISLDRGMHLRPRTVVHEEVLVEVLRRRPEIASHRHELSRCIDHSLDLIDSRQSPQ